MITKLCIVCLCVAGSSMLGLKLSRDSAERVRFYEDIVLLIRTLSSNIQFRQENLRTVLLACSQNASAAFTKTVEAFLHALDTQAETFEPVRWRLKPTELAQVKEFFCSLGKSDGDTQLYELNGYELRFEEKRSHYAQRHKKYGGMFLKLSFLVGIAIGILLI